jgi:hypothetical protein
VIQTEESSVVYVGNNSTTAPYPISFYFFHDEDLLVSTVDTLGTEAILNLNTEYIVTGAGNQNGGSLTTTFAVPIDWHLRIERIVEPTQLTSYQEGDAFPALSHERALDKLTMLVQQALRTGGSGSGGGGGRAWADDAERQLTTPNFIGQLGFQVNTATIYYSTSTATGAWKKAIFDNLGATAGQLPTFSSDTHLTNIVIDGVATLTGGVVGAVTKPAGDLVGTTQPQTLINKTLESPVLNTPTGLTSSSVGLGNVNNTSDVNKPVSNATQVSLDQKEDKINKGQNGGYAGLDATGKVPLQQMPQSVLGANVYQGTWNAATNTPTIPAAALANQGWYWVVSVAGSTNIDGISTWAPGDWIISNGTAWERIINIDSVSSVNAMTGAVVVTKSHVGLANVDNTSDATKNAAAVTLTNKTLTTPIINSPTGLVKADVGLGNVDNTSDATKNAAAVTLTNKTIDGANNTLRVRLDTTDVVNNLAVSHLNSGSGASATTFWRGDGQWITPPGSGDVTGPAGAVPGELATYANSTGKLLGRTTLPANIVLGDTQQGSNPANSIIVPSYVNHPDRIITNPTAFDDHFEGTSLNAKWITSAITGPSSEIVVGGSHVTLSGISSNSTDGVQYGLSISQDLSGTADFTVTCKAECLLNVNNVTGSIGEFQLRVRSVTPSAQGLVLRTRNSYLSAAGDSHSIQSLTGLNFATLESSYYMAPPKYFRFIWTRSTLVLVVQFSSNGVNYINFRSYAGATTGFTASILPQRFEINTYGINLGRSQVSCDWITFTAP